MKYLYDAFISFSWKDISRARRLHERLLENGYTTWYAEKNLRAGDYLPDNIWRGLEYSRYVLVINSRHYAGSRWAKHELNVATHDEIKNGITKIVFLNFDSSEIPYGSHQKLYVDFRNPKKRPFDKIVALLNQTSDGTIRGLASAMRAATDINEIRDCAHRLSAIARLRRELVAVHELGDILLKAPSNYHVADSAAWALGDIGVWEISDEFAREIQTIIEDCVATSNPRLIDKMAYISGEIAISAKNPGLRQWAFHFILKCDASSDADIRSSFRFTKNRISIL